MKKMKSLLAVFMLTLIVLVASAFKTDEPKERKFKIELSEVQVNQLYYALDKSNAEHDAIVKPLLKTIETQVQEQVKAFSDTTSKKK